MRDKLIKEFRFFVLTEYEEEEQFLREKHKQGLRFVKVTLPGCYYFEKCEPEDFVYKLDFNPQPVHEKESYIQLFKDYGFEYIQDLNEYSYFRKKTSDISTIDNEIFCDNESRLDMLRRIIIRKLLPILALLLCVIALLLSTISKFDIVLLLFVDFLFLFYIYLIVRIMAGYRRLKEKYAK